MIRAILFCLLTVGYLLGGYIWQPFHFVGCLWLALWTEMDYPRVVFLAYDKWFNTSLAPVLNPLLGNPKYKFGAEDETVSSAIGKNLKKFPHNSNRALYIIDTILTELDPKAVKSHCIEAIQTDEGWETWVT